MDTQKEDINDVMARVREAAAADDAAEVAGHLLETMEPKVLAVRGWIEGAKAGVLARFDSASQGALDDLPTAYLWDLSFAIQRIQDGTGDWDGFLAMAQAMSRSHHIPTARIAGALLGFIAEEEK